MTGVSEMDDVALEQHLELVDARTDARELAPIALLREAKLAGISALGNREHLVEQVARAWVGLAPDLRYGR